MLYLCAVSLCIDLKWIVVLIRRYFLMHRLAAFLHLLVLELSHDIVAGRAMQRSRPWTIRCLLIVLLDSATGSWVLSELHQVVLNWIEPTIITITGIRLFQRILIWVWLWRVTVLNLLMLSFFEHQTWLLLLWWNHGYWGTLRHDARETWLLLWLICRLAMALHFFC